MTDPSAELDARIRTSFQKQAMMDTIGAELLEVAQGCVRIRAPVLPSTTQQQGFAHAALTFAIGDSSAGYAALTLLPKGMEVVTAEIKINLLAPATGPELVATGRVVKSGKRLSVVTSEVARSDGTLVAILQGTMVPVVA
ncbi:MAG: PaaI family thioesterase [Dinoroseobacter sp.]|nr:PaaI family thioesterase [Dinoroseobacter sp.]MDJ0993178.1 PaaI family thioesterase [Dinoroseobacter sp.]